MSTPTPAATLNGLPQKRPHGGPSTPAANATTPKNHLTPTNSQFNAITSPNAQRSVASPAKRSSQFAGKSPHTALTPTKTPSTLGGKTLPSHLGATGLSPAANHLTGSSLGGHSNGAPMLRFDSPSTLSLGLGSLTAPGSGMLGGVGMGLTMSSLGITASAMGRADEEERRRRLENVLHALSARPGYVSAEALTRLCKRSSLSFMEDPKIDGKLTLSMAGETFVLDVDIDPARIDIIERVDLSFPSSADSVANHAAKAAELLKRDLQPPSQSTPVWLTLNKFSDNLERLARLDKLSVAGANCFEAVAGVYKSLRRLYDHEKSLVENVLENNGRIHAKNPGIEVMCSKSGRPTMHSHQRIGLSLDYWTTERLVPSEIETQEGNSHTRMEIDHSSSEHNDEDRDGLFSLIIECEASVPNLYPPIRISEEWVSKAITKDVNTAPVDANGTASATNTTAIKVIDWLEPSPPLIPAPTTDTDTGQSNYATSQPLARFVAKLEPPLVLPWQTASELLRTVNISLAQNPHPQEISTFDAMLIADTALIDKRQTLNANTGAGAISETREIHTTRSITLPATDGATTDTYDLALHIPRRDVGYRLTELPFQHPRQLVEMLPTLRQYAFINSLLRKNFATLASAPEADMAKALHLNGRPMFVAAPSRRHAVSLTASNLSSTTRKSNRSVEDELATLLGTDGHAPPLPRKVDVTFSTIPTPQLSLIVPREDHEETPVANGSADVTAAEPASRHSASSTMRATLSILPNAELAVRDQSFFPAHAPAPTRLIGALEQAQAPVTPRSAHNPKADSATADAAAVVEADAPSMNTEAAAADTAADTDTESSQQKQQVLATALAVCEDFAVWGEWCRGRFAGGH